MDPRQGIMYLNLFDACLVCLNIFELFLFPLLVAGIIQETRLCRRGVWKRAPRLESMLQEPMLVQNKSWPSDEPNAWPSYLSNLASSEDQQSNSLRVVKLMRIVRTLRIVKALAVFRQLRLLVPWLHGQMVVATGCR